MLHKVQMYLVSFRTPYLLQQWTHFFCGHFFRFVGRILINEWSSFLSFNSSFDWISHSSTSEFVEEASLFSGQSKIGESKRCNFGCDHSLELWLMMESTKDCENLRLSPAAGVTSSAFPSNLSLSTILSSSLLTNSSLLELLIVSKEDSLLIQVLEIFQC